MERRLNRKVDEYFSKFKEEIRNKVSSLDIDERGKTELLIYIYDFPKIEINKEDVSKRKRVKNVLPTENRCSACRANGEQCTRRRKEDSDFCGTHFKATPHGVFNESNEPKKNTTELIMRIEEINGIVYYIDNYNNVYNTEEIMQKVTEPKIIGKYIHDKGVTIY
uniref:Uncharacterized protein n=1 Tax=viral metagenome TaxID=1070528 RepID=A0A6C0C112_9ZZZZ